MKIRHIVLGATLASTLSAAAWPGMAQAQVRTDSFFYRYILPLRPNPAPTTPDPDKPQQVPKSTEHYWQISGKVALTYQTRLFDLGLFPHTSFVVNGTLLGNSPYAYWGTSNDSTISDLCQMIYQLPDGPWECFVRYDAFALYQALVIIKRGDYTVPIEFLSVTNDGATANPPELFGGATPQIYTINKY